MLQPYPNMILPWLSAKRTHAIFASDTTHHFFKMLKSKTMKKRRLFILCTMVAASCTALQAQKAYEKFDYDLDADIVDVSDMDDANGWSTQWTHGDATSIVVDGLDYNGIETPGNAAFAKGETNRELNSEDWPDEAGREYWVSFLALPSSSDNARWGGLSINSPGITDSRAYIGMTWGADTWGGYYDKPGGTVISEATIDYENPSWVVVKFVMSGDSNPENVYCWINPDPEVAEMEALEPAFTTQTDLSGGFGKVGISCGPGDHAITFDEILFGTSWSDVDVYKGGSGVDKTSANAVSITCTPNVVSTTTTVKYNTASAGQVKIALFNVLGNEVAVLQDAVQGAGSYELTCSADGLSDGVYFCKLQAGKDTAIEQIIVKK